MAYLVWVKDKEQKLSLFFFQDEYKADSFLWFMTDNSKGRKIVKVELMSEEAIHIPFELLPCKCQGVG